MPAAAAAPVAGKALSPIIAKLLPSLAGSLLGKNNPAAGQAASTLVGGMVNGGFRASPEEEARRRALTNMQGGR